MHSIETSIPTTPKLIEKFISERCVEWGIKIQSTSVLKRIAMKAKHRPGKALQILSEVVSPDLSVSNKSINAAEQATKDKRIRKGTQSGR
jgi:hypothetical protein